MSSEPLHNLRQRPGIKNNPSEAAKSSKVTKKPTIASLQTTTSSKNRLSTTTSTGRLSTSTSATSSTTTAAVSRLSISSNQKLSDLVHILETRLSSLEAIVSHLTVENTELRETVAQLQLCVPRIEQQSSENLQSSLAPFGIESSPDQAQLNSNIVIRGVEATAESTDSELRAIYEGLRSHLNISECADFEPVSVTVLSSNSSRVKNCIKPIRIQLPSVATKVKFLQIRRAKRDILQSDIVANSTSRRPVLISEQLTRENQELLYKARSLRGQNNYKFVWSSNGQILARQRLNSKVVRITDSEHVNRLRAELNLEPLPENGRLHATSSVCGDSNNPSL